MSSKTTNTQPLAWFLLIAILVFAPLAFGTVELWSLILVELGTAVLALLLLLQQAKGRLDLIEVPGIVPLLLLLWMVIQVLPLPMQVLQIISPSSAEVYRPLLQVSGADSGWFSISVNTKATLFECIRIGSYTLFYVATIQLLKNGRQLQKTVKVVVACAVSIAFVAILQRLTSPEHFYWFRPGPGGASLMGPWVNRSQYSGFMAMLMPVLLGLFLYYRPRFAAGESLRARIVTVLSGPGSTSRILLAFGLIVVVVSILLAMSRGGIIVTFVSLLLLYILLAEKKSSQFWPAVLAFVGGLAFFYFNFGVDDLSLRFNSSFTEEGDWNFDRIPIWRDTLPIIKDFWLTGSGFGTYVDIFPPYKTIAGNSIYDHAHNDYLELLTDGGIIGFILAAWFVVAVLKSGRQMLRKRRDQFAIVIGTGALVGILSMLLYGITDFNMHNGADGLYFFFLCGLLVSASHTRFQYHGYSTMLGGMSTPVKIPVLLTSIVIFAAVIILPMRSFVAREMFREVEDIYFSRQLPESLLRTLALKTRRISLYDPLEGTYLSTLSIIEGYLQNDEGALKYAHLAALRMPLRGEFLQRIALLLPREQEGLADELMELSYRRSLKKDVMVLNFAEWLRLRGLRERAVSVLAEWLAGSERLPNDVEMLLQTSFSREEVVNILPQRVGVWGQYADFLDTIGQVEESIFYRKGALDFLDNEEKPSASWFTKLYSYYMKQGQVEDAVALLRLGIARMPEHAWFRITLGDYYKKEGILYRAREEYEQALVLDPANESIKKKIDALQQ